VIFTLAASEPAHSYSCGGLSKWLDTPWMVVSNVVMSLCVRGSERLEQLNNCQLLIEDLQHEVG
jgi:hypothetical protein